MIYLITIGDDEKTRLRGRSTAEDGADMVAVIFQEVAGNVYRVNGFTYLMHKIKFHFLYEYLAVKYGLTWVTDEGEEHV